MLSTLDTLKRIKVPEPNIDLISVATKVYELNQKVSKLEDAVKPKRFPPKIKKVTVHRIEKLDTPPKTDELAAHEKHASKQLLPTTNSKPIISLELSKSIEK